MANIIKPFASLLDARNSIFLAGPCPRLDYSDDWRFQAFEILDRLGFSGAVMNPTNAEYGHLLSKVGEDAVRSRQVAWENAALHTASAIVFWVPRNEKFPALTTNFEFGEWYKEPHVFVGWPDGAEHNEYMQIKLTNCGKSRHCTLESLLAAAVLSLNAPKNVWFTSDTHFRQKRTLDLSRRPFLNVDEMDMEIVSNWNKRVTMNDIVVHGGDFMDPVFVDSKLAEYLGNLNFKKLHWVLGNWDRGCLDKIQKAVLESGRDIEIHESQYSFTDNGRRYVVVHEPNDFPIDAGKDDIVLFGHIHGRDFAKRNGFDIGTDYHGFAPINMEQLRWFTTAMSYWDGNVFSDRANAVRA